MARTFKNLQDECLAWLDESGDTGTTLTIVKNALNEAQRQRLAMEPWKFLWWDTPETFTVASGTRVYTLHQAFWKPLYFFNRGSKGYLREVGERSLPGQGVDWNTASERAARFRFVGLLPVAAQPAASSQIVLVSSSASDTTAAKAITIRGVTSNGITTESLTPNGTSNVTSSNSFTKILNVSKAADWVGTATLTAGAVTLLKLFPTEYSRTYPAIELLADPTDSDTIEYRFLRLPATMSLDGDIPEIPAPHEGILIWDALLQMAGYLTEISAKSIEVWKANQERAETALREAWIEGQTAEAEPSYIRDTDEFTSGQRQNVFLS